MQVLVHLCLISQQSCMCKQIQKLMCVTVTESEQGP